MSKRDVYGWDADGRPVNPPEPSEPPAASQKCGVNDGLCGCYTSRASSNATNGVLAEIYAERRRQDEKWGEQNHPSDHGAFDQRHYRQAAEDQKAANDDNVSNGYTITWNDILIEEVYEAFAESDPRMRRKELVQAASVIVNEIECLDRRLAKEGK